MIAMREQKMSNLTISAALATQHFLFSYSVCNYKSLGISKTAFFAKSMSRLDVRLLLCAVIRCSSERMHRISVRRCMLRVGCISTLPVIVFVHRSSDHLVVIASMLQHLSSVSIHRSFHDHVCHPCMLSTLRRRHFVL